ncbi:MAG TPA: undecaprenyldiphospho-muramoylpentapeptide beta-N-acetylglucosaminyltransferase [Acidimicrobiales bacterium]|nr:undecaprenyldiphospho-muramoylpentapeptide beta-N-acetylglucosaminyltransferase [Acidimicrobiales bacterium]
MNDLPDRSHSVFAVIAGGGTGGHAVPAVAIARALVDRGHPPATIHFVGSARGIERRLVPEAGFSITLLPGRGIARRLTPANVGAVAGLLSAAVQAFFLLRRLRPSVVVTVGGYASAPCAAAAVILRIPLIVEEQNATPGLANRLAGRFALACAVSFPGTPLPRSVVTGNPVRQEIISVDRSPEGRAAAKNALGLPADRTVVAVAGGSLGARRINEATLGLAALWADRADVAIRHVIGERDFERVTSAAPAPPATGLVYQQIRFEDRMDLLLAAADVTVQRAGASTVSELTVAGVPSVLVPLPGAPGDHQTLNARTLADAGAAVLVPDSELDGERLARELDRLIGDRDLLDSMAAAAEGLGQPDAASKVAALAEEHARA